MKTTHPTAGSTCRIRTGHLRVLTGKHDYRLQLKIPDRNVQAFPSAHDINTNP